MAKKKAIEEGTGQINFCGQISRLGEFFFCKMGKETPDDKL
jgi:hypothetical protein